MLCSVDGFLYYFNILWKRFSTSLGTRLATTMLSPVSSDNNFFFFNNFFYKLPVFCVTAMTGCQRYQSLR